jgi:hypothetical protein
MPNPTPIAITLAGGARLVGFTNWSTRAVRAFEPRHSGWRCLRGPYLRPDWSMNAPALCLMPEDAALLYIYGRRGTGLPPVHVPLVPEAGARVTIPLSSPPDPADAVRVGQLLHDAPWTFARTMPDNPHHYTARRYWRPADFDHVVEFIRRFGHAQRYNDYVELVLEVGGYFYWSGALPIAATGWINRKPLVSPVRYEAVAQTLVAEGARLLELPSLSDDWQGLPFAFTTCPFFRAGIALFGWPATDLRPRLRRRPRASKGGA